MKDGSQPGIVCTLLRGVSVSSPRVQSKLINLSDYVTPVAGSNLLSGKSIRFSELFFGILLSEFRFTVFIPGAVKRIHEFPTAILSQEFIEFIIFSENSLFLCKFII